MACGNLRPSDETEGALLKEHLFNWKLWPDFSQIPDAKNPVMRFETVALGNPVTLNRRTITPLPANHVVPAVGYRLESDKASLVITGDTTSNDALWPIVNEIANLKYLIIETALSDREGDLARRSKHFCPSMLTEELANAAEQSCIRILIGMHGLRDTGNQGRFTLLSAV